MKFFSLSVLALVLLILPLAAQADHHEVIIHQVARLGTDSCAVELEIEAANQNGFEGVDRIELNGTTIASIGDAEAAAINSGGHVNAGDMILFASDSFEGNTGLAADVLFGDSNCASFSAGDVFTFVIDDPLFGGPNAVIDTLIAPSGFGNNSVAVKATETSTPQLVDLLNDTVVISNNAGADLTLGQSGNSGGGCRLSAGNDVPFRGLSLFGLGLFPLAWIWSLRKRAS